MRYASTLLIVTLAAACGPAQEEAEPAGPTLADFAGTWHNMSTLEGVADPVPSTFSGSAAGNDWTMTLEGRDPVALTVSVHGDSLISETEEYESILRAGVMVSVRSAAVLQNGELVGNMVATYRTPDGMEEVRGTIRGTRGS